MTKLPRTRITRLVVLILTLGSLAGAQVAPLQVLDDYISQTMTTFQVPGVAIAIVKDDKVVLAKGYGVRKLGESARVDEHTLFGIGSNTAPTLPTSSCYKSQEDARNCAFEPRSELQPGRIVKQLLVPRANRRHARRGSGSLGTGSVVRQY